MWQWCVISRREVTRSVPRFEVALLCASTKCLLFIVLVLVLSPSGARARARKGQHDD